VIKTVEYTLREESNADDLSTGARSAMRLLEAWSQVASGAAE